MRQHDTGAPGLAPVIEALGARRRRARLLPRGPVRERRAPGRRGAGAHDHRRSTRDQSGDVYVDQNLGSEPLPGPDSGLAGLPYALLRTEVLRLRPAEPPSGARHDPPRVLAYFGGTDAFGASPVLAAALARSGEAFDATFVAPRPELRAAIGEVPLSAGPAHDRDRSDDRVDGARRRRGRGDQRVRHVAVGAAVHRRRCRRGLGRRQPGTRLRPGDRDRHRGRTRTSRRDPARSDRARRRCWARCSATSAGATSSVPPAGPWSTARAARG